jgi:hypothetical protein
VEGILTAVVVVVGALCLLDLLLTFGVIRRLQAHTGHLEQLLKGSSSDEPFPPVGAPIDEFTATTTAGEPVGPAQLTDTTVVAFFSPGCSPCREKLPAFVAGMPAYGLGREQILAVVSGAGGQSARAGEAIEMADALARVARAVVDGDRAVANAFHMNAFPGFCVVDGTGTVLASGSNLDRTLSAANLPWPMVGAPDVRSATVAIPS